MHKKYPAALTAFILFSSGLLGQTPPGGEVACYPFKGNALDHSGNGHHGTVFGAFSTNDRYGIAGEAFTFDGVDDHIDVLDFNTFGISDEVSMGFWVRVFNSHGNFCVALWPDDFLDRFECSPHYGHSTGNTIFWDFGDATAGGRSYIIPYPFVSQWEHFIFTSSAMNDRMRIYHDGVLIHEEFHHSTLVDVNRTLGLGGGGSLPYLYLDGDLDDVVLYDRELTLTEAEDLHAYGLPCEHLEGIGEPGQGHTWIDIGEGGNTLVIHGLKPSILEIFDAVGHLVARVTFTTGDHVWQASGLNPGIYVASLTTDVDNAVAVRFPVQ